MSKRGRLALIDGDSMAYFSSKDTLEESLSRIDSFISLVLKITKCDHYLIFLSSRVDEYYRRKFFSGYKIKRPTTQTQLLFLRTVKSVLFEKYKAISVIGIEADDLCAIAANQYKNDYTVVVCSPDKDVLGTIPGKHYNYKSHQWITTTEYDSIKFMWLQVLHGDATDGIIGLPGIGKVKAEKILLTGILEEDTLDIQYSKMEMNVYKAYRNHYGDIHTGIFEYQKNFRLVYLLRNNENYKNECGSDLILPEPFKI